MRDYQKKNKKLVSSYTMTHEQLKNMRLHERISRYKEQSLNDVMDALMERCAENRESFWKKVSELAGYDYDELDSQNKVLHIDWIKGCIELYEYSYNNEE